MKFLIIIRVASILNAATGYISNPITTIINNS